MINKKLVVCKCISDRVCKNCDTISNNIVINRIKHLALYCDNCGAYVKQASMKDSKLLYAENVDTTNKPKKVIDLLIKSNNTSIK